MSQTAHEPQEEQEETEVEETESSAETENTETTPPSTVPYNRFKEVNDELREFKSFEDETGYSLDDLKQLTAFEDRFAADPAGTWVALAQQLGDQLPEPVREALSKLEDNAEPAQQTPTPGSKDDEEEPPSWAKPLVEDYESRQKQSQEQQFQAQLDGLISDWNELDVEDKIVDDDGNSAIPDGQKHTYIIAHLRRGTPLEKVLEEARQEALDYRESILKTTVPPKQPAPRSTGSQRGTPAGETPAPPKTLADATRMARLHLEEGG